MADKRRTEEPNVAKYAPWVVLVIVLVTVYSMYNASSPEGSQPGESTQSIEATATTGTDKGASAAPKGKEVEITAQALNMRSTPAKTPGNVVATLTKGTVLKLEEQNDGWLKVTTSDGRVGFIAYDEKFLRIK